MSLALGRLILSPSTTSDLSLRHPKNPTHFPSSNFLQQSNRRRYNHGGEDEHVSFFGLRLCSDGGNSILRSRSSCFKVVRRFPLLYFGRQSFTAAVMPGGFGSTPPADHGFDHDGLGGDGGDGGKEGNGGGGSFDGGDSGLEGFPVWWWWQWLKKQSGSRDGMKYEYNIPIEVVWPPEEQTDFAGKVKEYGSDVLIAILEAILRPFAFLAVAITDFRFRRSYVPLPFIYLLHFDEMLTFMMQLILGTALLLTALLLWSIWRRSHRGGSAGDDQQQGSGEDSGDDSDE